MNRYSAAEIFAQGKTVITAHSACEGTLPNSREHVLAAIASGAEMIDVDVRMDDNGALYMSLVRGVTYCAHPIADRELLPADRFTKKIDQGENRYSTEVVADNVYFGDSKREGNTGNTPTPAPSYTPPVTPDASDFALLDDDDAQLPF